MPRIVTKAIEHALAARSAQGEFVFAEGSSHEIPHDRPDLVVDAIKRVLEMVNP